MSRIKVFIVDDHSIVIEGIRSILEKENNIEWMGHANDAEACLQYLSSHETDIILMDIGLPGMNGIDLCAAVKKQYPLIQVIALSTFAQSSYIKKMMESGASGYLLKNCDKEEMMEALSIVHKGGEYLSFDAAAILKHNSALNSNIPVLTRREKEVLAQIADGLTNIEIGNKLFISTDTVDSHRKNIMTKLNVKNTALLIRYAMENGLI